MGVVAAVVEPWVSAAAAILLSLGEPARAGEWLQGEEASYFGQHRQRSPL